LVAVIGKQARNVSEDRASGLRARLHARNDISERSWQRSDPHAVARQSADTFKPMGPKIVSGIDPMNQVIEVRVNGRSVSSYKHQGHDLRRARATSRACRAT